MTTSATTRSRRQKNVDKGAEGLDCVHEMNTINHYVGMFPDRHRRPVEKPLAKFFFGFFAVVMIAFAMTGCQKARSRRPGRWLCRRCSVDDRRPVRAGPPRQPRRHYEGKPAPSSRNRTRSRSGGDNVTLYSNARIVGLIAVMGVVVAGVAKIRHSSCCWPWFRPCCRFSLSSPTPAGCGSSATTCIRGAPLRSSLSCRPCLAKARLRSSRPSLTRTGVMAC